MTSKSTRISKLAHTFHGRSLPEEGTLVGYAALIDAYNLEIPMPQSIAFISNKNRKYRTPDWIVLTPKHKPEDTLYKHLVFALKYEGINLLFFKKMFLAVTEKEILQLLELEPNGHYSRTIWFLYEWLLNKKLKLPNANVKLKYTALLDEKLQYAIKGESSARHRIINNLPGTQNFCPLIHKTEKLEKYIHSNISVQQNEYLNSIHKDILQRTSAFLLLKDSKASFTIERENPSGKRAAHWGQAIGQAGIGALNKEEILRLQQIVIESSRFTNMGFRTEGGFVGAHDRTTGEPIPDHISARWQDVDLLINGLLDTNTKLEKTNMDAILAASLVAFGFVFIHPFTDGNGRIHRYLIHHVLARNKFTQQGIIFPVSASILDHINDYRKVLESYSKPVLNFIEWRPTANHNVEVLNNTIDYYRYFDATLQAEFLYDCVADTINNIIPNEVKYLEHYDEFKRYLDDAFEMPDKMVANLVRFLEQGNGKLSKRVRQKEFKSLAEQEVMDIQKQFIAIFHAD